MTLRYMLDSDVISYIAKGRPPEFRRRRDGLPADQLCISAITRSEVYYGLSALPADHRLRGATDLLLRPLVVPDWPASATDEFARIKRFLSDAGKLIDDMDLLIAAHALDAGLTLVTGNLRHFERIPGLSVVSWRDSPAS